MKPLMKYEVFRNLISIYYYGIICIVVFVGGITLLMDLIKRVGWLWAWFIVLGAGVLYAFCGYLMAENKKKKRQEAE
jgi:hypothetical protein